MTISSQSAPSGMSIGSVLDRLRPEFPDITVSKIRFLEAEGLVSPQRTRSGYRRFSLADCERLRFVLTAQRDQYLPLKVIKEQLEAIDSGVTELGAVHMRTSKMRAASQGNIALAPSVDSWEEEQMTQARKPVRITRSELLSQAVITDDFLTELIAHGLITPVSSGFFTPENVDLAIACREMTEIGIQVRHLRSFKLAADREAMLVTQIIAPIMKSRDEAARDRAEDMTRELVTKAQQLHSCLVKTAIRDYFEH